jgi:hypothetical protein
VDRRGFIRRAGAALATVLAAPLFIPSDRLVFGVPKLILPTIYGDGIHDDTAAIQAMLDRGGTILLAGGSYRLTNTLTFSPRTPLNGGHFIADGITGAVFDFGTEVRDVAITNIRLDANGAAVIEHRMEAAQ